MAAEKNNKYNEKYTMQYFKKALEKGINRAQKDEKFCFIKHFHKLLKKPNNWYWLQLSRHSNNSEIKELSERMRDLLDNNWNNYIEKYLRP